MNLKKLLLFLLPIGVVDIFQILKKKILNLTFQYIFNPHKRPQQVISTPHDFRQHEKIGEIFKVIFTGVNFL